MLNGYQQSPTYVGSIMEYCINFNVRICSINFLNVRREANQTPCYLAKYVLRNLDCI